MTSKISGLHYGVAEWQLVTDSSGQPIGTTFKVQLFRTAYWYHLQSLAVQDNLLVPPSKFKLPTYSAKTSGDVLLPKSTLMIMSSTLLRFYFYKHVQ